MPEEQSKPSSGNQKRRRSRRPSRKRRRPRSSQSGEAPSAPASKPADAQDKARADRRRRRRKSRSKKRSTGQDTGSEVVQQADPLDARLSDSVFVYTHVLRSAALDTYGYRPDAFHNQSRTLDDFRIDLSALFPGDATEDATEDAPIFDSALHGPVSSALPDDEPDEPEEDESSEDGAPDPDDD
jgi:hypothetical protein